MALQRTRGSSSSASRWPRPGPRSGKRAGRTTRCWTWRAPGRARRSRGSRRRAAVVRGRSRGRVRRGSGLPPPAPSDRWGAVAPRPGGSARRWRRALPRSHRRTGRAWEPSCASRSFATAEPTRRGSIRVARAGRAGATASLRRAVAETIASVERAYWTLTNARLGVGVREQAVRLAEEQLQETQHRVDTGDVPRPSSRSRGPSWSAVAATSSPRARRSPAQGTPQAPDPRGGGRPAMVRWARAGRDRGAGDRSGRPRGRACRAFEDRPELDVAAAALERRQRGDGVREGRDLAEARRRLPPTTASVSPDRPGPGGAAAPELDGRWGAPGLPRSGRPRSRRAHRAWCSSFRSGTARRAAGRRRALPRAAGGSGRRAGPQADPGGGPRRRLGRGDGGPADRSGALRARGGGSPARGGARSLRRGLSTNFLVLTRQNDLSRARLDEITALTDYRTARTELARATGQLIEERGIHIDGSTRREASHEKANDRNAVGPGRPAGGHRGREVLPDPGRHRAVRVVPAAAEAVTTVVARGGVAGHADGSGSVAVHGVAVSADLPGIVRHRLRVRPARSRRPGAGAARHPAGAGAARRRRVAAGPPAAQPRARRRCSTRG